MLARDAAPESRAHEGGGQYALDLTGIASRALADLPFNADDENGVFGDVH